MLSPCAVCACVCDISIVSTDFCFVRTFHSKSKSSTHCRRHFTFLSRVVFVPCPETSCVARSPHLYVYAHIHKRTHTHGMFQLKQSNRGFCNGQLLPLGKDVHIKNGRQAGWLASQVSALSVSLSLSFCMLVCMCVCDWMDFECSTALSSMLAMMTFGVRFTMQMPAKTFFGHKSKRWLWVAGKRFVEGRRRRRRTTTAAAAAPCAAFAVAVPVAPGAVDDVHNMSWPAGRTHSVWGDAVCMLIPCRKYSLRCTRLHILSLCVYVKTPWRWRGEWQM